MRIGKTWLAALLLGTLLGVSGCNSISFFPSKAAEKAADRVLDDILPDDGLQAAGAAKPPEPKVP